jgi:hypothetical protein
MKTVFNIAILFYGVLLCTPSFAQRKTVAGFYITTQGDTIRGAISNYSQWSKNPSKVEFVSATSGKPITLIPQDCKKVVIEGHDEYLPYTGQRLMNPIYDNHVASNNYSNPEDEKEDVNVFLRFVTKTTGCELYVLTDSKRTNFFYKLPGDTVVELKYKKYYLISNIVDINTHEYEVKNIVTISEYKDQINNLFAETIEKRKLSASLKLLSYTEDELKKFFENLFTVETIKNSRKNIAEGWIISAGVSLNNVHVKADKSFTLVAKKYNSSISPMISLGYMVPIGRNFNRYFLYPQVNLFRYENTGEINDGTFKKFTTYQTDLVLSGEVNGGVNVINQQSIRFYLAGGAGMMALLNNRRLDYKYLNYQSSLEPYRSEQTSIDLKATSSVNVSAGMVIMNKFIVTATYLFPSQLDNVFHYTPKYSGVQFRVGYKIK